MAAKEKTLNDALYETLKDAYWAKKQAARSLGKSAKAAKDGGLKQAIEGHREQSAHQSTRRRSCWRRPPARTRPSTRS